MKPYYLLLLPGIAFFVASPSRATIDRTIDKTFTVNGSGTLRLNTSGGSLTVQTGPVNEVKITAKEKIRADSDEEADKLLKDLDLRFEQTGNDVTASAKYTGETRFSFFGGGRGVQVSFVATVPASYAADLHTSGGSISVGDLSGNLVARTSGGSIKLGKMGGRVDAHTSGGSVTLAEARGEVTLKTSGGAINVGRVAGPAELGTSGGSISIDSVEQSVQAHTSGGSIHAGIVGPLKGDCVLSTSGGSVRVTVDKTAAFHLDAATSGGGVHVEGITITLQGGSVHRNKVNGDVNGGGPLLKAHSSGGGVTIQGR